MKFQHSTGLQPNLVLRQHRISASGGSVTLFSGQDATFTITVFQYFFGWTALTSQGQISVTPGSPSPAFVIYEFGANGDLVVPGQGEQVSIGTHGLVVQDSSAGGSYVFDIWYSIYQT